MAGTHVVQAIRINSDYRIVVLRQLGDAPQVSEARVVAEPILAALVAAHAAQAPIFPIAGDLDVLVHVEVLPRPILGAPGSGLWEVASVIVSSAFPALDISLRGEDGNARPFTDRSGHTLPVLCAAIASRRRLERLVVEEGTDSVKAMETWR